MTKGSPFGKPKHKLLPLQLEGMQEESLVIGAIDSTAPKPPFLNAR